MSQRLGAIAARSGLSGVIATTAATALAAAALVAGGALSATALPAVVNGGQTSFEPGRYIVTLADDAASTYEGGVRGMAATKPDAGEQLNAQRQAVQSYTDYLGETQQDVAASVGASIDYSYTLSLNGFSAELTASQAAKLSADKQVARVEPDELKQVTAAVPSTEFLGLEGEDGVWAATGGRDSAGAGVVVGVLDTGIAPENPSFAGEPLGSTAGSAPYLDGDTITFAKGDGSTFTSECITGEQFGADDCSTKIVGARYFVTGFGAGNLGDAEVGEYVSPRDGDGHGSHTASTAAGDGGVETTVGGIAFGEVSGVAPAAKVAAYKVCWSGPDPVGTDDDGCASSDLLAGIDAAVADGVDVINYSIGGGAADTTVSATDQAFLGAAAAGVFVSASAGNSGPDASTLDNASPWITTVAASTIPTYEATATLGNGELYAGASVTVPRDADAEQITDAPLVNAASVAVAGAVNPNLCLAGTLDPALVAGSVVVCERGENARVDKSAEVARAGGLGMILVNVTPSSLDNDLHVIPTIHLDADVHEAVQAYAATEGATVTFAPDNLAGTTPPTPQVAGFSSRGPVLADGSDVIKPDIAAPGVAILAAGPNAEGAEPTWQFLSGTSMAAPHIAGLAALYLGERPNASVSEIKSAMMTTAYDTVDASGAAVTDPFAQGAGHVDPTRFFEPGLLYENDLGDWLSYIEGAGYDVIDPAVEAVDPSQLNLASIGIGALTAPETITRTVTSTQAGTFTPSIAGLAGIDAQVSPAQLSFGAAGESQEYTVTFTRTDAALDEFATGSLTWASGETTVRSPIAVQPVTIVAPSDASGTGVDGSTTIEVTPGGSGEIPLSSTGLSAGVVQPDPTGESAEHSGSGVTGDLYEYTATVGDGVGYARFDLDSLDDTADLDLVVYLLDEAGEPIAGWQSATGSADERVNLVDPEPGTYQVLVDVYSAPTETEFDLTTYAVAPGGAELALDPPVLTATQGVPVSFTASWSGLLPNTKYLGSITYGETGASTLLEVVTGESEPEEPVAPVNTVPPTITGTPAAGQTLTAAPGEWDTEGLTFTYQWQRDGVDVAGATAATYTLTTADEGTAISVIVTASATGIPSGTAASASVIVAYATSTSLSLNRLVGFSWQKVTATVGVTSGASDVSGTVTITVNGTPAGEATVKNGKAKIELPKRGTGIYSVRATFVPASAELLTSTSPSKYYLILF